ncbi:type VI secretion system protein TssA [Albimonas pacifica]|uniref:Type VI secretion system protein ImpA n=1 Tax=Albimonas pacifica TaxID=1114924 RepID=A0A1I3CZ10_9RHOB|nr:type VI secretion system protein TssA [Albimonas pacifica]SFH79608.1 type VI secretion system protein ImpA [Albimonas pacifica]
MFDLDPLLQSFGDDAPSGENLEYDAAWTELEIASQPVEERVIGDSVLAAEDPDYEEVARQALALLGRSRDLRVAVRLAEAGLRTEGLAAFARTLAYIEGCLEGYWDSVHPQLDAEDDDDPTMRVNAVLGLADRGGVLRALRQAPLTESRNFGRYALRDIELAEGEIAPAEGEIAPDPQAIHAAFQDTPDERLAATAETADAILGHVKRIAAIFDDRLGAMGPDLAPLQKLAHDIARRIPRRAAAPGAEAPEAASAPAPGAVPAPAAAPAAVAAPARPGAIETPQDVVAALDRICDYYARKEPSSPLPLILKRARRLVSADFLTVIRDLAPLGLENVSLVGGISGEAEAYADYED